MPEVYSVYEWMQLAERAVTNGGLETLRDCPGALQQSIAATAMEKGKSRMEGQAAEKECSLALYHRFGDGIRIQCLAFCAHNAHFEVVEL